MPVTRDQAQMIATLATNCRPIGARHWDEPGLMAAIARVKDWSLHEAIHEVIAAAADRTAETPGVIGKAGNHRKPAEKPPEVPRVSYDPRKCCHVCGVAEYAHDNEHPFLSVEAARAVPSKPPPFRVHNHGYDPSCIERMVDGRLRGHCVVPPGTSEERP